MKKNHVPSTSTKSSSTKSSSTKSSPTKSPTTLTSNKTSKCHQHQVVCGDTHHKKGKHQHHKKDNEDNNDEDELSEIEDALELEGKYEITKKISQGTFAVVYEGKSLTDGSMVALKRLYPTSVPKRILMEVQCLKNFGWHRHIVKCLEGLRGESYVTIVLEKFEHDDFKKYYTNMGLSDLRSYMKALFEALVVIHEGGVVHRDIKPANFLHKPGTDTYCLVDFGLAQDIKDFSPARLEERRRKEKRRESSSLKMLPSRSTKRRQNAFSPSPMSGSKRLSSPMTVPQKRRRITSSMKSKTPLAYHPRRIPHHSTPKPQTSSRHRSTKSSSFNADLPPRTPQPNRLRTIGHSTRTPLTPQTPAGAAISRHRNISSSISCAKGSSHKLIQNSVLSPTTPLTPSLTKISDLTTHASPPVNRNRSHLVSSSRPKKNSSRRYLASSSRRNDYRPLPRVARCGTRGFRAPEVLLRISTQSTALDIWSAGVIMLTIMSRKYPLFAAPDDMSALEEIAAVCGYEKLAKFSKKYNRKLTLKDIPRPEIGSLKDFVERVFTEEEGDQYISAQPPWDDLTYDLLDKLLALDPKERFSAKEALKHNFFVNK